MKVKDLIKELEELNPEARIIIDNIEDETGVSVSWSSLEGYGDSDEPYTKEKIRKEKLEADLATVEIFKKGRNPYSCEQCNG